MWRPDVPSIAKRVSDVFGIELVGRSRSPVEGYPSMELRPAEGHASEHFSLVVELGWRSFEARFAPGAFAGPLISEMGEAPPEKRRTFERLATLCVARKGEVRLNINGATCDPAGSAEWPEHWRSLDLQLRKTPATVNTDDAEANDRELALWLESFLGLVLALLPVEDVAELENLNPEGLPEGACVRVEVNRYERSRVNRANCIALHGDSCKACGFNFGESYGAYGDGFIHVHHILPVSRMGAGYVVDPFLDLVPLCANCHAMAHRSDPPASVDQLRDLLGLKDRSQESIGKG